MPADRADLDIIIRAKNLASDELRKIQTDVRSVAKSAGDVHAEQRRILSQALMRPEGLSARAIKDMRDALTRLGGPIRIGDPARQIRDSMNQTITAAKDAARQTMVSFQGATTSIGLLGAGVLRLTGPLGIAAGLFAHLGGIALNAIRSIIAGIIHLAQAIIAHAVAALRTLTIAFTGAAAAAAGLIALILKVGFSWADFARESQTALENLLGSRRAAKELFDYLVRFARVRGLEARPIVDAGIALENYGLSAQRYLPMAADLAAGMNEPVERLVDLLGRADIGLLGQAAGAAIMLRKRLQEVGVQFTEGGQPADRAQFLAGIEAVWQRHYQGLSQRMAGGWKALWANMTSIADEAAADISMSAYGLLDAATQRLRDSWDQLQKSDAWQRIKERAGGALAYIAEQVAGLLDRAPDLAKRFADMLDKAPIEEFLSAAIGLALFLYETLGGVIARVSEFIQARFAAAGVNVRNVWEGVGILIAQVAAGIGAAVITIIDCWPQIAAYIEGLAQTTYDAITFMLKPLLWVLDALADGLAVIYAGTKGIFATLKERKELERVGREGWRGLLPKVPGKPGEPALFSPKDFAGKFVENIKATWSAVPARFRDLAPTVELPPLAPLANAVEEGAHRGTKEGVKEALGDFVHEVWGATAEMIRRAGLTPQYYASIGAPILAGAVAGPAVPVDVQVTVREDIRESLRDPAKKRDFEAAIEETIESWARRQSR